MPCRLLCRCYGTGECPTRMLGGAGLGAYDVLGCSFPFTLCRLQLITLSRRPSCLRPMVLQDVVCRLAAGSPASLDSRLGDMFGSSGQKLSACLHVVRGP